MAKEKDAIRPGQNRRKRIVFVLMGTFLAWALYTWNGQEKILDQKQAELETYQSELAKMKKENEMLQYKIQRLHDPEYVANLARKHYYLSKEGEIIFEIITDDSQE